MALADLPRAVREWVPFSVYLHIGGGIGDVAHRFYDSEYLRRLTGIKDGFPRLSVLVYMDGKRPDLTAALFEGDYRIDRVITAAQRPGDFDWTHIDRFMRGPCRLTPQMVARELPGLDPEMVMRRVVERVNCLMRFPRVRAISFDDFFQQMGLSIGEFRKAEPGIMLTPGDVDDADALLAVSGCQHRQLVCMHACTADHARVVWPADTWKALLGALVARHYAVAVLGGPDDNLFFGDALRAPGIVDATFDGRLRTKYALLRRAAGTICIDSGPMHLSWLAGTPTVCLVTHAAAEAAHNNHPGGYHWAVSLMEPFACRLAAPENMEDVILALETIMPHKGVWRGEA